MKVPFSCSSLWRCAAAVCSGVLLACSFPPVESAETAWIALIPLILTARFSTPRAAFKWGWLAGVVFWLTTLSWMLRLADTGGALPVVLLGWALLAAYCAVYMAAFTMVLSWCWGWGAATATETGSTAAEGATTGDLPFIARPSLAGPLSRTLPVLLLIPVLWVGFEYLRSTLFSGFPWNALGVSQYRNVALIQIAEWGGVYAVSAMVALLNAAFAMTGLRLADVYTHRKRTRLHVELMAGLLACALCWVHGIKTVRLLDAEDQTAEQVSLRVSAVQSNVHQTEKWSESRMADIYERVRSATELAALSMPDLLVWPETAVPNCVLSDPGTAAFVRDLVVGKAPLLAGSIEEVWCDEAAAPAGLPETAVPMPGLARMYNSAILFDVGGAVVDVYRKRHLVPFGEYVPLERHVRWLSRLAPLGFSCSAGTTSTVFRLEHPAVAFSSLICFEDAFAGLARASVRNGAEFLINQTNDAWFEGTASAVQHMSHCVFRCVENRVPAVRCANLGVTCFIDRVGRLDATTGDTLMRKETELTVYRTGQVQVPVVRPPATLYARCGDLPFALPSGAMAAVLFLLVVRWEKQKNTTRKEAPLL